MVTLGWLHDPLVHLTIMLAMALLFAVAALHKLTDQARFALALEGYARVFGLSLPMRLQRALSRLLPVLELLAALGLLYSLQQPLAALPALLLLVIYTLVLALTLRADAALDDCGCNPGKQRQPPSAALVLRNLLLCGLTAMLLWPVAPRTLGWFDLASLLGAGVSCALLYALANQLISNHSLLRRL
ncbi:MauE/DoxX family redox-associated membrane protein [Halopseudomonas oceani]|uniref:MauE/DoxX family redox-associated membrane protein n=1 Tax=Halopseudomonas oceani TaxID=1708783 RepID=UPI002AA843B0|nr:MauE/DoxX family redox-associated membrane protein [Halopseudomonas oceani]